MTLDLERVRRAVVQALEARDGACMTYHGALAGDVVERLRGPATPTLPEGAGYFVRDLDDLTPEAAARWLPWVAVCVTYGDRKVNRDREWFERYRNAGGEVACWSWFTVDPDLVAEGVRFAASVGARWFILNGEKELRGQPDLAHDLCRAARAEVDRVAGMSLGLVSYSVPWTVKDFPWSVFAEHVDFGMPEIYDREGEFDPRYPRRCIEAYRDAGFKAVVPCCGVYQRQDDGTGWRWRTAREIRQHLALFPRPVAWCAWGLGTRGRVPEHVLAALAP